MSEGWLILLAGTILAVVGFFIKKVFFSKDQSNITQTQKGGSNAEMYQAGGTQHIDKSKKND